LLGPLVVQPIEGDSRRFHVIAGNRRLAALRDIHRGDGDPKVPCEVRDVDAPVAEALSLAENFAREAMHPLDEAEAFARLAKHDGKGGEVIAAEFGVTPHYVRQRMKLATLAEIIKDAYREGRIDTLTAEAFASVPPERQLEVWKEVGGNPRHAEHVRNVIAHAWIDAKHAEFDLSTLPEAAVSQDLFGERVLVERSVFLEAQSAALARERETLTEQGWCEVVVDERGQVQDRLFAMKEAEVKLDKETRQKLKSIGRQWEKLEKQLAKLGPEDEAQAADVRRRQAALEAQEERIAEKAPKEFTEATKAVGTAFLMLDPDGRVRREYRVPAPSRTQRASGNGAARGGEGVAEEVPQPPTSDELSDRQLATTFTHQAIGVRQALLADRLARKRVLVLILHDKVRSEALAIDHDANGTTLHAEHAEGFTSPACKELRELRSKLDPFKDAHFLADAEAYEKLKALKEPQLDKLIELLTVDALTAHLQRETKLIAHLAAELEVHVREQWTPDADWLSSYQKCQLAHLMVMLRGAVHAPATERKKTELVKALAELFANAAANKLEDAALSKVLNEWLPVNLRPERGDKHEHGSRST
jgi:ParB/RepB/Spo0J family partition protein